MCGYVGRGGDVKVNVEDSISTMNVCRLTCRIVLNRMRMTLINLKGI